MKQEQIITNDGLGYPEVAKIFQDIINEIENSNKEHNPNLNSTHEWYGVLKEEVDELWDEIKKNKNCYESTFAMRKEAIQISAMAIKGILSIKHRGFR